VFGLDGHAISSDMYDGMKAEIYLPHPVNESMERSCRGNDAHSRPFRATGIVINNMKYVQQSDAYSLSVHAVLSTP
jgi:hypothetical protein